MEYLIINEKNEFWNGHRFMTEYPEALLFGSQTKAFNAAEKAWFSASQPKKVWVVVDYGLITQKTVDYYYDYDTQAKKKTARCILTVSPTPRAAESIATCLDSQC